MKHNRYDLNDNRAYDGRPTRKQALSPRTPAPTIRASGHAGRATSGQPENPVSGITGNSNGARRPKGNTMRNARHGGGKVSYFDPAELDTVPRPTASAPPRIPPQRPLETHEKTLAAAETEGIRKRAMQHRSVLITNGAVGILPRTGPVWAQETNQHDHVT